MCTFIYCNSPKFYLQESTPSQQQCKANMAIIQAVFIIWKGRTGEMIKIKLQSTNIVNSLLTKSQISQVMSMGGKPEGIHNLL
jgi:hypothetical protein